MGEKRDWLSGVLSKKFHFTRTLFRYARSIKRSWLRMRGSILVKYIIRGSCACLPTKNPAQTHDSFRQRLG